MILITCANNTLDAQEEIILSLDKCRQMALENSEDIKQSDNAVLTAKLSKQEAFASYLPKIEGSFSGLYMTPDIDAMGMNLILKGVYLAGISLQQPIYAGGKIYQANKMAQIGKECAEIQKKQIRSEIITQADNAYWTYIAVLQKVKMMETYLDYIQTLYDNVSVSVDAQMATRNDLLRIQTKQSELQYNLQKAQTGKELCRIALCNTIGVDFASEIIPIDTIISVDIERSYDVTIDSLPEILLMQKNIEVKQRQQKIAFADYLPTVGIGAGYSYAGNIKTEGTTEYEGQTVPFSQTYKQGQGYAMLSVSIPIWNWGATSAKYKKAKIETENAESELDKNSKLLQIRAIQSQKNLENSYSMITTADLGVKQAEENLRMMQDKFDASLCTLTDLLDAQSQWQQAQSNLIEAQTQYMIYKTEHLKNTGRLQ